MSTDQERQRGGFERDDLAGIFQLQAHLFIDRRLSEAATLQDQQVAIAIAIEAGLTLAVLMAKSSQIMGIGEVDVESMCECLRRHAARPMVTNIDLKQRAN